MSGSRVLLVGGGITSALTASLLLDTIPNICLTVWDKARGAGGRMSTSRSSVDPKITVDLGAQYISATAKYFNQHRDIYNSLLDHKILIPANVSLIEGMRKDRIGEGEETQHFVVPDGMSSLVKHMFQQSGAELQFQRRVAEINEFEKKWRVRTECGLEDLFDIVVLTMPVPQILAVNGDVAKLINTQPNVKSSLENVSYSTRFVLGLYYSEKVNLDVSWACKYISDHPIIRFISIDNIKRAKIDSPTSLLVHSTVQFGLENINKTHEEMKPILLNAVTELLPALPPPTELKSLKWLYSQVHKGYPSSPGSVLLQSRPSLILGGDAFSQSNFDGCVESATAITKLVAEQINQSS